jgi:hypothetical protein
MAFAGVGAARARITAGKPSLEKVVREEGYDGLIITGVCTVGPHAHHPACSTW